MIDTSQWKFFNLTGEDGIFRIESCKCSNAGELLEDGNALISYISENYVPVNLGSGKYINVSDDDEELLNEPMFI